MENSQKVSSIKTRISQREIEAQQGPFLMWDDSLHGFCARRQFSDAVTFSVIYRARGERNQRWLKIGRYGVFTPTEARAEARRVLMAVAQGRDPAADLSALRGSPTVDALLDQYIADMQSTRHGGKKLTTQVSDLSRIKTHIRPALGSYKVASVSTAQLEAFMHGCTPGSAKRILQLVGAVFSFAVKKKYRLDNPCRGIAKPQDRCKTRRLSTPEYAALGAALRAEQSSVNDLFAFLAVSGWRLSEARGLRWDALDCDRRLCNLADSKTGASVRPLSQAAIEIIGRQKAKGEFVFIRPNETRLGQVESHWQKLKMPRDITCHTLRHSYASLAADLGFSDSVIGGMIGHRQQSITSRYLHIDAAIIKAADKVAQRTLELMGQ